MTILKKLDLFKSINPTQRDGTILGTLLTFVSVSFIIIFFTREINEYRSQKLSTKLYVQEYSESIKVSFDISFLHINCTDVYSTLQKPQPDYKIDKTAIGDGCRVTSTFNIEPIDNMIVFSHGPPKSPIEMIRAVKPVKTPPANIDFSHEVNRFQLDEGNSYVSHLETKFPDMIKANALEGVAYHSTSMKDGHSLFLYEVNVITANIRGTKELIYNYNKNTVNLGGMPPFVNFKFKFSAIGVEYIEGNENVWEFLTYLLGIVGGILAIVKYAVNMVGGICRRKDSISIIPN